MNSKQITAKIFNSGFPEAHDTYNGLSAASDGCLYYVLCSTPIEFGGRVYKYDPKTEKIVMLAELDEVCGEKNLKAVPQGKSHSLFYEYQGRLYFSTHIGYYNMIDNMERYPSIVPDGYELYPGGHLIAYDLKSGEFEDLHTVPDREAVVAMGMDTRRGIIWGITWPTGFFFRFNVHTGVYTNFGKSARDGESGHGDNYRVLCRSIPVDLESGVAYYTNPEGEIFYCGPDSDRVELLQGESMRKDYFGSFDPASSGSMGYNWRQVVWHPDERIFYGVHGNSGYLFTFNPREPRIELLERLTSDPSRRSGMGDQFSYGYLGFTMGADKRTIYYLTGGPVYDENGERVAGLAKVATGMAKGVENLHLVTYDIPTGVRRDHGAVFYPDGMRPLYVNSIGVTPDGTVYTLARIGQEGGYRTDLIKVPYL